MRGPVLALPRRGQQPRNVFSWLCVPQRVSLRNQLPRRGGNESHCPFGWCEAPILWERINICPPGPEGASRYIASRCPFLLKISILTLTFRPREQIQKCPKGTTTEGNKICLSGPFGHILTDMCPLRPPKGAFRQKKRKHINICPKGKAQAGRVLIVTADYVLPRRANLQCPERRRQHPSQHPVLILVLNNMFLPVAAGTPSAASWMLCTPPVWRPPCRLRPAAPYRRRRARHWRRALRGMCCLRRWGSCWS